MCQDTATQSCTNGVMVVLTFMQVCHTVTISSSFIQLLMFPGILPGDEGGFGVKWQFGDNVGITGMMWG